MGLSALFHVRPAVRIAVLTARCGWHDRSRLLATDGLTPHECVRRQIEPEGYAI